MALAGCARFVDVDEKAALTAFHPHGASNDLLVGDLILRLAAGAEKLHSQTEATRGRGPTRGWHISVRGCRARNRSQQAEQMLADGLSGGFVRRKSQRALPHFR